MNDEEVATLMRLLADGTRLGLLRLLAAQRQEQPLCVGALAARLGVSQPAVSQHLRLLGAYDLVRSERVGVRVHYHLNRERWAAYCQRVADALNLES